MLVQTDSARRMALLLALLATRQPNALPARAGAAGGTPSPFYPPYPDYGCDAHCIVRHEAEFRYRAVAAHRPAHRATAWCWRPN